MKMQATKAIKQNEVQTIASALKKHLKAKQTVTLDGVSYSSTDVLKKVEQYLALLEETTALRTKWRRAVADERAAKVAMTPFFAALKSFVANQFGESSEAFGDFGYVPRKAAKRTVASKARAVQKQAATRASHHVVAPAPVVNGASNGAAHS